MTPKERNLVKYAMEILESMPCGGIGRDGYLLGEIKDAHRAGDVVAGDAIHDTTQHAWRLLEAALSVGGDKS